MNEMRDVFEKVKTANWNNAIVSFFIVKRRLVDRVAHYHVLQVNADDILRKKLRKVVSNKINDPNNAIEYDFNTTDFDDNFLGLGTSETDFQKIVDTLQGEEDLPVVDDYHTLLDSWLYISRLDLEGCLSPLFAVRTISKSWKAKKVINSINAIFKNSMLINLEETEIFNIDDKMDFFSFEGIIFIADKKNFEIALNFREGLEKNRDKIVEEFKTLHLFVDADEISRLVGNNIKRLRKLSQVKKAGYYNNEEFLIKLKQVSDEKNWGIEYSQDGKLLATEDNIDIILKLLNNDRLTSPINQENFDVDVKHKLCNT